LRGALAQQHVVGLDLEVRRDGFGELAHLPGVAARLRAAFEDPADGVEHFLAGTDRVLVARDADDTALDSLQIRRYLFSERGPHAILTAAAPDAARESRARSDPNGLDETTSRQRHGYLPFPDEVVAEGLRTLRNTSVAFCISSMVPSE